MHDEVFEAHHDSSSTARDTTTASSPSEAYANLSLETRETSNNGTTADADADARMNDRPEHQSARPTPRSSSPAKRPASDMDDADKERMDVDQPAEGSPRAAKSIPTPQRSLRATSVDMADASSTSTASDSISASNGDSTATSVSEYAVRPSVTPPSLDEQVQQVLSLHEEAPREGQEGFVISEKWLARVFARTSSNANKRDQFDKSATEGEIGPVDNSDLVDPAAVPEVLGDETGEDFVPLKHGLTLTHDFEILPAKAWNLVVAWYGIKAGSPTIRRYVHNTALGEFQENLQYELYPPIFTIRKLRSSQTTTETLKDSQKQAPKLVASRGDGYQQFLKAAKQAAGIDVQTKVQVWRVLASSPPTEAQQPSGMLTPESSPRNGSPAATSAGTQSPPLLIDVAGFSAMNEGTEREMVTGKDETANEKYNGHMNLQLAGLAEDQVLILEEQDSKGDYVSETTRKVAIQNGVLLKAGSKAGKGLQSNTTSGRNSPALSERVTRGRTRSGRTRGTVGLTNLGNTCYMNSALQCIRSVEELTVYFLQEKWKEELNPDNPLGHNGAIAKAYAGLMGAIYGDATTSSFAPKNFKTTLGRAQPLFSGYGQQDSQEFLSFLVDGLHEDLNRIAKKPYIEYPESDDNTHKDPEAIKALGDKFRAIHRARNDSVATDLFNGFYKNTMVCPDCDKVSITFDPFSLITLQLPIEQTWTGTVIFVPLRGSIVKVEVDIDKNASIKVLKEWIAKRFPGVEGKRLMAAEIYSHKFYRVLEDNKVIAELNMGARDDYAFFELEHVPTNFPVKKKPQSSTRSMITLGASSEEDIPATDSPHADRMLVPIFHRGPNRSTYRSSQWTLTLWPSYIVLTREEAKDQDAILRKVIGKVAQMTTRPILSDYSGNYPSYNQSQNGSDTILTTEEDASPNGDPRVHDGSVEGEDNMVEVTMTEPGETPMDQSMDGVSETESNQVPEVLQPGGFIPPEFRALFEMKVTRPGKEMVPTGWSSIDPNKVYKPISSRVRVPSTQPSSVGDSLDENSNGSSTEDADDTPQFSADAQESLEPADESTEEEMPSIETPSSDFNRGGRQKNRKKNKRERERKNKNGKTYGKSKKARERLAGRSTQPLSDDEPDDDPALVRLGEAIVLEWNSEAYDALFEGNDRNDDRGTDVWKKMEIISDPELQKKKAQRAARKRNGITLDECFNETSKSEILSEDNAWYCGRCKELRRATKTLDIWTAPDILVIHLKRFSSQRNFRDKIEALVDFPIEGLDLTGKVGLPEGKELIYDLFAVDNHYGGLGGGHYTAYAQNFFDKKWYEYNDSSVSQRSDPKVVITSAAYLLFYRRRASAPLGPPELQAIVEDYMNPGSNGETDNEDSKSNSRNTSPSGNGRRLGDSSRNGSSSAGTGAAAGAQLGALSSVSAASLAQNGVGVAGGLEDEEDVDNPPDYDEGYGDPSTDLSQVYAPLYEGRYGNQGNPNWGFDSVVPLGADSDTASDTGAALGDDVGSRMIEDFGDDEGLGMRPGNSTPIEEDEDLEQSELPMLIGQPVEDAPATEIRLPEA